MKVLERDTILKVGKIKVAREVNINTNSTKKSSSILTHWRPHGLIGLGEEFPL